MSAHAYANLPVVRRNHLTAAPPPRSGALAEVYPLAHHPRRAASQPVLARRGYAVPADSEGGRSELLRAAAVFVLVSSLTLACGAIVYSQSYIVGQSSLSKAAPISLAREEILGGAARPSEFNR